MSRTESNANPNFRPGRRLTLCPQRLCDEKSFPYRSLLISSHMLAWKVSPG